MRDEKRVILLVEDSDFVKELTKSVLQQAGYGVKTASGTQDLEAQIKQHPCFLDDVDLIILDMELREQLARHREDKTGTHVGEQLTGSQIGMTMALNQPKLSSVPFLLYSGKERSEIQVYLDELNDFSEFDDRIRNNYKGFVEKKEGSDRLLLSKIKEIFEP